MERDRETKGEETSRRVDEAEKRAAEARERADEAAREEVETRSVVGDVGGEAPELEEDELDQPPRA